MNRQFFLSIIVAAFALAPDMASAQAYCELRDPTRSIRSLFPKSTNYQSVVRTIDKASRKRINSLIPLKDGLHFNELGQHTLYTVYQKKRPVGFVHVRAEQSRWGLIEVAWAISLDLKIIDFRFQRCRNPRKRALQKDENKAFLKKKSLKELRALLTKEDESLKSSKNTVPGAEQLSAALVRCAIKTLVTTAVSWRSEVVESSLRARVFSAFPKKAESFELVNKALSATAVKELQAAGLTEENSSVLRKRLVAYKIKEKSGQVFAILIRAKVDCSGSARTLWLALDKSGTVLHLDGPRVESPKALKALVGLSLKDLSGAKTSLKKSVWELVIIGRALF